MTTLKQPTYGAKQYIPGCNSRGLKSRDEDPQLPTTERGKRRKQKPAHVHQWTSTKVDNNTSYHEARIQNEQRFVCSNASSKPTSGGVVRGGAPHKKGCGCTCKAPKA